MILKNIKPTRHATLEAMATTLQSYLAAALSVRLSLEEWPGVDKLPVHFGASFSFKKTTLLNQPIIIAFDRGRDWSTVALEKQFNVITTAANAPVLFVPQTLTAYDRNQLIQHKIAFIVPGRQIFLPPLGLSLSELYSPALEERKYLLASSQAVVIHALLNPSMQEFQPVTLATQLGYTRMTMTRVFDELVAANLAECRSEGHNRILTFTASGRELWTRAKPFMRSPVKKRMWVTEDTKIDVGLLAGESALSEVSDLNPPPLPVLAVPPGWKQREEDQNTELTKRSFSYAKRGTILLEYWAYPPELFTKAKQVDRFNLYLSLMDVHLDERVAKAVEVLEATLC